MAMMLTRMLALFGLTVAMWTAAPALAQEDAETTVEAAAEPSVEVVYASQELLDATWVIVAAAMVFLMQVGFLTLEVGLVRPRNINVVALKNLVDWVAVSLAFLVVGFGVMFGGSVGGMFGGELFLLSGLEDRGVAGFGFFMFQLAFCGTAATIVSGAMSERTGFVPYLVTSLVVGLIIYPLFGHWAWGNLLIEENDTLLTRLGFRDFAGSTVVHSVGGWVGLIGAWIVGPRMGRFGADGKPREMQGYSVPFAVFGTIVLWFGWWGFNGGSTLGMSGDVGKIITNTNVAAAAAGFSAFTHCWIFQKREALTEKLIGGVLGGLVAITACCDVLDIPRALLVGLIAGIVHNVGYVLMLKKFKIDDPVGAIPVHLFCGIFGTLAVAMADADVLGMGNGKQLAIQAFGVGAAMIWTIGCSLVLFVLLKSLIGLRVPPDEEITGLSMEAGMGTSKGAPVLNEEDLELDANALDEFLND